MKYLILLFFCVCLRIGYANDSTVVYKNKVIVALAAPSFFHLIYHTIGYSRLIDFTPKNQIDLYGGIGFLPKNDYAFTTRAQIIQKTRVVNFSVGCEYTYMSPNYLGQRYEHRFLAKLGFNYNLFKNRFYIAHYINFGRIHTYDPNNNDPRHTTGNIGLDLGFNF